MPNNYPFPHIRFDLGTASPFVKDLQRALGIVETGVFDFLTMCHVVVHKFNHGLNHNDPTVGEHTWTSIFSTDQGKQVAGEVAHGGGAAAEMNAATPEGVATIGQMPRSEPAAEATTPIAAAAPTTTGTTNATNENIPIAAQPDTNPDEPREDQPTVTAQEQQAQGGAAGGAATHPTEEDPNARDFTPDPAVQNPPNV